MEPDQYSLPGSESQGTPTSKRSKYVADPVGDYTPFKTEDKKEEVIAEAKSDEEIRNTGISDKNKEHEA